MHIVVFPGWYPNRKDKLSGDFIQRHMHALALFCKVSVVIAVKDGSIKKAETATVKEGNLHEIYHYYPSLSSIRWVDNLLSFIRYNYISITTAGAIHKNEKVDVAQLYVLQKNHFTGLLLKILYGIPYVASEQSTFYVDGRLEKLSSFQQNILRSIFNNSASWHAVSTYLASTLSDKLRLQKEGVVIGNVVNEDLFYYKDRSPDRPVTFVHVSNMSAQKNVEGMLAAFAEVQKVNKHFILNLVGPLPAAIGNLITALALQENVVCWNERSYKEVAEIMQQSDVFVFFTRYETFGCVIIEANACGLPVIASDLAVTRELITDNFNGLLVQNENVQDLASQLLRLADQRPAFDRKAIALQAHTKFNYRQVGEQLYNWLRSIQTESEK